MNNNINITAVRIRRTRKLKGLTQQELADRVGISKSTICKYEKGKIETIKKNTLCKIAAELGCSYAYLIDIDLPAFYTENSEERVEKMLREKIYGYLNDYESFDEQGKQMIERHIDALLQFV